MTLDDVNALPAAQFVERFGGVFEHAPWVAQRVVDARPFASVQEMHALMCAAVAAAGEDTQLELLRAHPELASKAALAGALSPDSNREQDAAGLLYCSHAELASLRRMNSEYSTRFGFPFIVAVRGLDRGGILARLQQRLGNDRDAEFAEALRQVERIAAFRLHALLDPPPE